MSHRACRNVGLLALSFALWPVAGGQTGEGAPSERAKHDADKVFQMILQHADKPRRVRSEDKPPEKGPAPSAVAVAPAASRPAVTPAPSNSAGAARVAAAAPLKVEPAAQTPIAAIDTKLPAMERHTKLELVSSIEPEFPVRVLRGVHGGSVVVQFIVQPDGRVASAEVTRSPHRGLNEAAIAAVSAWRFKAVTENVPGVAEFKLD